MDKYLERRWKHAKALTVTQVTCQYTDALGATHYSVQSSMGGWYHVHVTMQEGKMVDAHCPCKDFGTTKVHGVDTCYHALAAGIYAHIDVGFMIHECHRSPNSTLGDLLREWEDASRRGDF